MPYADPEMQRAAKRAWRDRHVEQERERRRSYRSACPDCGGVMSSGHGAAKEPARCRGCSNIKRARRHGTASKYNGGCRCDACRAAHAKAHREWYRRACQSKWSDSATAAQRVSG